MAQHQTLLIVVAAIIVPLLLWVVYYLGVQVKKPPKGDPEQASDDEVLTWWRGSWRKQPEYATALNPDGAFSYPRICKALERKLAKCEGEHEQAT